MANGLIGAALLSGFGQGAAQAAQTGMQLYGASMLQQQRAEMENKRLALMEQYASSRERRGYAHAEAMQAGQQDFTRGQQQEQFGQNQLSADLAVRRAQDVAQAERDRLRNPDEIAKDAAAENARFTMGAGLREGRRNEDTTALAQAEIKKAELLGSNPAYLENERKLADAKMSADERMGIQLKQYQLTQSQDAQGYLDRYVQAVQSGDPEKIASTKRAYQAFSQKPWDADKVDATNATAIARELGNEITHLSAQKKDAMGDTAATEVLDRKINDITPMYQAALARAAKLSGVEQPKKSGPINIVDPFASPAQPGPMDAKAPKAPAPPAEKTGLSGYLADEKPKVDEYLAGLKPGENPVVANAGTGELVDAKRMELQNRMASLQGGKAGGQPPVSYQLTQEPRGLVDTAKAEAVPADVLPAPAVAGPREPIASNVETPATSANSPHETLIRQATQQYPSVRPELLRAVLATESNHNPQAVGREVPGQGTAKGVAQFMDATAKQYGVTDPFDPGQSIPASAHYLSDLLKKYDGSEAKALAAYNFGPARVDRGEPWPKETLDYVKKTLARAGGAIPPATGNSYSDVLATLPPEKRDYVEGELDTALQLFKSGKIDEKQFKARVVTAWSSVPGSDITQWNAAANALTQGLLGEARKGSR